MKVYKIDPKKIAALQPECESDDAMLNQFITPLTKEEFMEKHWNTQVCAAFCGGGAARSLPFKKLMDGLDLATLLEKSPSEGIMVWCKNVDPAAASSHCVALDSVTVDEKTALKMHEMGAALYFRAPEEVSDAVLTGLCTSLGMNFSSFFSDGERRSETETFVARKGHVTGWHTDFQNNFTIQLRGSRKWRLRKPDQQSRWNDFFGNRSLVAL